MKFKHIASCLVLGAMPAAGFAYAFTSGFTSTEVKASEEEVRFICGNSFDNENGERYPTTFVWTSRGKTAVVRWKTDFFKGSGFDPKSRCEEVSPRFQEAYNNGSLNLMTNGTMNAQPVICTARETGGDCDTLLMTLRPEDDSLAILNQLKEVFNGRASGPVSHSSATPQVYIEVDVDEFLRTAPVEQE